MVCLVWSRDFPAGLVFFDRGAPVSVSVSVARFSGERSPVPKASTRGARNTLDNSVPIAHILVSSRIMYSLGPGFMPNRFSSVSKSARETPTKHGGRWSFCCVCGWSVFSPSAPASVSVLFRFPFVYRCASKLGETLSETAMDTCGESHAPVVRSFAFAS